MIQRERLIKDFQKLTAIDSLSFQEREMADALTKILRELDVEVFEDDVHRYYHSQAGNIYGYLKGNIQGSPVLFSAHMDTVEPGIGKKAIFNDEGIFVSDGKTILGSDDVAGIVAILEALRVIKEDHLSHRDIEVFFPIAEEVYIQGSRMFDYSQFKAKQAYVLDLSGPIGTASLQEPTLISFQIEVIGQASHAGFSPETGIHAIAIAAKAIEHIQQGRIDEETTVNIGKINGGTATNIVPEKVVIEGEIRSYQHQKALDTLNFLTDVFQQIARASGAAIKVDHHIYLEAYQIPSNTKVVQDFVQVCQENQIDSKLTKTFGGSDNNSLVKHSIQGIVLACGMNCVHSTQEYMRLDDLEKSTHIVLGLMCHKEEKSNVITESERLFCTVSSCQ